MIEVSNDGRLTRLTSLWDGLGSTPTSTQAAKLPRQQRVRPPYHRPWVDDPVGFITDQVGGGVRFAHIRTVNNRDAEDPEIRVHTIAYMHDEKTGEVVASKSVYHQPTRATLKRLTAALRATQHWDRASHNLTAAVRRLRRPITIYLPTVNDDGEPISRSAALILIHNFLLTTSVRG